MNFEEKRKFHFPLTDLNQCREKSGFDVCFYVTFLDSAVTVVKQKAEMKLLTQTSYISKLFYLLVLFHTFDISDFIQLLLNNLFFENKLICCKHFSIFKFVS